MLKWQEFWDTFEASILKNSSLQLIDKSNYLRAQLERKALNARSGLELTNSNYDQTMVPVMESAESDSTITKIHLIEMFW